MFEIYQSLSLLSSHSVSTCWLLVGEMTQEETLLMFIVSKTKNKSRLCLAAVLPEDCLLVVGGWGKYLVEIGCLQ